MRQVLVYADSLSWGIIPGTRRRLPFSKRWPGVFEQSLNAAGKNIRVIENCLNGRRTTWDDPFKPFRNGSEGLAQVIEYNSPLSLVVLSLGTNDFQCMHVHTNSAWLSAQGMAKLVQIVRQAPIERGMPVPEILIVAPPKIIEPKGPIRFKFDGAETRDHALAAELEAVAKEQGVQLFDAQSVTNASRVDGIHLDEDQHEVLGKAVAEAASKILS